MKEKLIRFIRQYRVDIAIVVALFIIAAIPRLTDLGTFLTADEKNWIGRSYEFIRAFKDFRFNDMLQTTHPGVTGLWLMGISVTAKMFVDHIPFTFNNLFHFVKAAQFPIALLNTLAIPAMYVFLRRLFSTTTYPLKPITYILPLTASLLIALDPFIIGYSRVAHIDALLMSFLFLAALATIVYAQTNYSRRWLVISAAVSSLAILTKAPAVFIIPFFGLAVLIKEGKQLLAKDVLHARCKDFVIWGLIIAILFVVLWPAILWVPDPKGNVLLLKRDLGTAALTPHHMAEDYTLNAWHYPAALLARTTPVTLVFAVVAIIWVLASYFSLRASQRKIVDKKYDIRILGLIAGYIVFFVLMMTLGAKKGDRYILPVWPALNVLAALGLIVSSSWAFKKFEARSTPLRQGYKAQGRQEARIRVSMLHTSYFMLPVIAMLYLAIAVYRYHPYTLAYSNPLFPNNLSQELGWGEGLEQVGAWLSRNAPDAVVASWYPEELGAYTSAHVAHINAHEQGQVRYIVLYRNMFGRAPDHYANDFIDEYYTKREPVFVAHVVGKEFAWVYEKPVYERVVDELVPGRRVGQPLSVSRPNWAAVDVLVATYRGRATEGVFVAELKGSVDSEVLQRWEVPVSDLEDNRWLTLPLPEKLENRQGEFFLEVYAMGTRPNNAPTLRYTSAFDHRPGQLLLSESGGLSSLDTVSGDLAIRLRYHLPDGRLASEEETKLLSQ